MADAYLGTIFWVFLAVVFPLLFSATLILFYKRRDIQPIKARHPTLVLLSGLVLTLWAIVLSLQRIFFESFPCWMHLWSAYVGTAVILSVYMIRAFFLYANYNLTNFMSDAREHYVQQLNKERRKEKNRKEFEALTVRVPTGFEDQDKNVEVRKDGFMTVKKGKAPVPPVGLTGHASSIKIDEPAADVQAEQVDLREVNRELWYRMHTRLLKKHSFVKILVPITLLFLLTPIIVTAVFSDVREFKGDGCLQRWHGAGAVLIVFASIYGLGFIFVAFKIRNVHDTYGIRNDLLSVGLLQIVFSIPWYILNNLENDDVEEFNRTNTASSLILLFVVSAMFFISITWPLLKSYPWFRLPSWLRCREDLVYTTDSEGCNEMTCEACMRNKRSAKVFEEHLKDSFAVQNLHFWQEMERFRLRMEILITNEPTRADLAKFSLEAQKLYKQYIKAGAPFQMNIGLRLLKQIDTTMERVATEDFVNDDDFVIDPVQAENMFEEVTLKESMAWMKDVHDNPNTEKMRALYEVMHVVQWECFKMLRDQYKFFQRSERWHTLVRQMEEEKEQAMFVHGGDALINASELEGLEQNRRYTESSLSDTPV